MTHTAIPFESDGTVVTYAWPGGYRVWYVADDGADLCAECVQDNFAQCIDTDDQHSGWFVIGHYTEADTEPDGIGPCSHCNREPDIDTE